MLYDWHLNNFVMNFWIVTQARLPITEDASPYAYEPIAKPALDTLLAKILDP
jgi:NTE family protein